MLNDKEIKSVIESSNSVVNRVLQQFYDRFLNVISNEDSSRKQIISTVFDFKQYCIYTFENSFEGIYIKGYKKGYEDALLNASNLSVMVDNALRKKKKKH